MATHGSAAATGKRPSVFTRLYTGTGAFDIVGRRKTWYVIFGLLMLVCIASMVFRGFNLGIDFVGGTRIQFPVAGAAAPVSTEQVEEVVTRAIGEPPVTVQTVGRGAAESVLVRTETLNGQQLVAVKQALYETFRPVGADGQPGPQVISDSAVSASWGGEITTQALIALAVFLVLVTIFLVVFFERAMAVGALVALVHDVTVTAGIYSIIGLEVSPSTIIGLLTILGFSLYDTVVVFDKVRENTRALLGLTRRTYAEAANLAINQTLMRSINTSLIAVLPVLGLLVIGVGVLGVGVLADLALVLMVGIMVGALSSIFLATPICVDVKMLDPRYQKQAARVAARRARAAAGRAAQAGDEPDLAGEESDGADDEPDLADDDVLAGELRRERAMAAAAGVPARPGKNQQSPGAQTPSVEPPGVETPGAQTPGAQTSGAQSSPGQPAGTGQPRAGAHRRPTGKSSRPSGKKRR